MDQSCQTCRHCQQRKRQLRRRGLCWACHGDLEIRNRYDVEGVYGKAGLKGALERKAPKTVYKFKLGTPTATLPGTVERMNVYSERVVQGQAMFHDLDRRFGETMIEWQFKLKGRNHNKGKK